MTRSSDNTFFSVRFAIYIALAILFSTYIGQGLIIRLRLDKINASPVQMTTVAENCDAVNCTIRFQFTANRRFILLGHILRTHTVTNLSSQRPVAPVTRVRTTLTDSWAGLKVYELEPGTTYELSATKYKTIKMGYFIGILPRETDHEGVLSVPDIGPRVNMITGLTLAFILVFIFATAAIGGAGQSYGRGRAADLLRTFALSAAFAATAAFISLGIVDTLLPEGEIRNKSLRFAVILSLTIPFASQVNWMRGRLEFVRLIAFAGSVVAISSLCWPWIRGGPTWAMIMALLSLAGSIALWRMNLKMAAAIWASFIVDAAKIVDLISFHDYPPVYLINVGILSSLTLVAGELGGFNTISLAGLAYRRFRRDLVLSQIKQTIENPDIHDSGAKIRALEGALAEISRMTGAGHVAITINLPLGRPMTLTYHQASNRSKVFDDGKIPGAVTLRSLVYGDEAMFELFTEFAARLKLPVNHDFPEDSFFCAVPLRVTQSIVGTMLLTGFDNHAIKHLKQKNPKTFMAEDREIIHLIAERISQSLSTLLVNDLSATSAMSRAMQQQVHRSIAASGSAEEFLMRFARDVHGVSGLSVMIHEQIADLGQAVTMAAIDDYHWGTFVKAPFNLGPQAKPAYGPTVVAFRDQKSSYVKDITAIFEKMHPKTVEIMTSMNVMSVIAVPFKTSSRSFVISLLSRRDAGAAEPGVVAVLEATEALFVAAIEVMSQKTSVLALGQLASRLIGDDEVRGKILEAARGQDLPTTIGSPRESFLLLFDLAGSSDLSDDTEIKARAYGTFYDAVNQKCQDVFGGMIRKTIGDAVIVTWDGTDSCLSRHPLVFSTLKDVTHYADQVARDLGCKGARAVLHHGRYFLGLVGTKTFGQIDVIGSGIDEVCKLEGYVKTMTLDGGSIRLAVSKTALEYLPLSDHHQLEAAGFVAASDASGSKTPLAFVLRESKGDREDPYAA